MLFLICSLAEYRRRALREHDGSSGVDPYLTLRHMPSVAQRIATPATGAAVTVYFGCECESDFALSRITEDQSWLGKAGPIPIACHRRQHFKRHVAAQQHQIVERLDVEPTAKSPPRLFPDAQHLVMPNLVGGRLSRRSGLRLPPRGPAWSIARGSTIAF